MKILNISKFHFNYRGGVEKEAKRVSEQISTKYKVDTICFGEKYLKEKISKNQQITSFKSIRVLKKIDLSFGLLKFIYRTYHSYDVVWIHYPNILPIFPILSKRWNSKYIIVQYQNDIKVLSYLYWLFKPVERALLNRADAIITSSPNYHEHSEVLKAFSSKIRPVPIRIPGVLKNSRQIHKGLGNEIILTTVGRYTAYKGYEKLVKLVSDMPGFHLNIVSSSAFPLQLHSKIEEANNIEILSNLDDYDLERVLKNTHVFVLSSVSRNEGFGIVLLEALRLGLPICVNHLLGTGSEYITKPGINGEFFDINNSKTFIDSINKIVQKSNYYRYCEGALRDFNSRFRSNEELDFLKVLNNLVEESKL